MSSYRFLFNQIRQYPKLIFLTVGLSLMSALFNGIGTALVIPVLLGFLNQPIKGKGIPGGVGHLLSFLNISNASSSLPLLAVLVLMMLLLKNITSYGSIIATSFLKQRISNRLKEQGLEMLLEVDIDFYVKTGVGDINNRLSYETTRTADAILVLAQTFAHVLTLLVFIGLLLSLSWQLTIISSALIVVVAWGNQSISKRAKGLGKQLTVTSKLYAIAVLELLSGMRLVRSAGNEAAEFRRLQQMGWNRERADFKARSNSALVQPVSEMTGILMVFLIILIGRLFLSSQVGSFSSILLAYLFILFRSLPVLTQLNFARNQLAGSLASVEVIQNLLQRRDKPFMTNGSQPFTTLQKGIRFESVSFTYPQQRKQILSQVDLYVPRHTTLALVGASGAGKSTLADLLPRFYDPTEGCIKLDGRDIREFDITSVRRSMGIVSQDTFLFNASVASNIAYGCPEATEADIIAAAKQANAYGFILELPQGLETVIGDRGVMLSGGQRQRLAIARAILKNPEILILDEATSALDSVSERLVQEALDYLSRDRTTIVIAHRLSTIQKADQIAVMEQGRVIELGSHNELLAKRGHYARFCKMQFTGLTQAS
jgi:ATP-binding cassette, subfamily B, bacterial MsbA